MDDCAKQSYTENDEGRGLDLSSPIPIPASLQAKLGHPGDCFGNKYYNLLWKRTNRLESDIRLRQSYQNEPCQGPRLAFGLPSVVQRPQPGVRKCRHSTLQ